MKRLLLFVGILFVLAVPVKAETIRWVNFDVPYESLKYALEQDVESFEKEKHLCWIDILALAACRTGGKCPVHSVKKAVQDLQGDRSPEELLGDLYKYYSYYRRAYGAVLGGMVGSFAIEKDGCWTPCYGLKAFSPIASGYGYSHSDDFGVARSFGFKRKHLGHDMMGSLGTPIVAVEAVWWRQWDGTGTAAGASVSGHSIINDTFIMPICRRIHPLPRGCRREIWCRRGT